MPRATHAHAVFELTAQLQTLSYGTLILDVIRGSCIRKIMNHKKKLEEERRHYTLYVRTLSLPLFNQQQNSKPELLRSIAVGGDRRTQ